MLQDVNLLETFFLSHFSFLLFHRTRTSSLKQSVTRAALSLNPSWNRLESNVCEDKSVLALSFLNFPEFLQGSGTALNTEKWMESMRWQAASLLSLSVALPLGTAGWRCSYVRDCNVYW